MILSVVIPRFDLSGQQTDERVKMTNTVSEIELAEKLVSDTWIAFQAALTEEKESGLADPWTRSVRALWAESVEAKYRLAELKNAAEKVGA